MTNEISLDCEELPLEQLVIGDLTSPDLSDVIQHLEACNRCQDRLQIMLALQSTLSRDHLRQEPPQLHPRTGWHTAAAFVLLTITSLLILLLASSDPNPARWASSHPHPLFPLAVRAPGGDPALEEGFTAYRQGRYQEAASNLARFPRNAQARLFRGISLYLTNRHQESIDVLDELAEPESALRSEALWYRAQAYLRLQRPKRALEELLQIRPESSYYSQAQRIAAQLQGNR